MLVLRCLLLALGAVSMGAVGAAAIELLPKTAREPVPDIAFVDLEDKPARLSDLRGQVTVLNLWATWCAPCREEMPSLERLQQMFADQPVLVLALSVDRAGPDQVRRFLAEIGVQHLAVYRDPKMRAPAALRVPGLPATLLIDREGREAGRQLGLFAWDGEDVQMLIRRLLAEDGP